MLDETETVFCLLSSCFQTRVIMDMSGKVTLPNPKLIQRDVMLTPFHLVSSVRHSNSAILCSNKKCCWAQCGSRNAVTYKQH